MHRILPADDAPVAIRRRRWRMFNDMVWRNLIGFGGISVIIAIVLIFFYLTYVVAPLFFAPEIHPQQQIALPGGGETAHLATEEYAEVGMRLTTDGRVVFLSLESGQILKEFDPAGGAGVTAIGRGDPSAGYYALSLDNGTLVVFKPEYRITYPDDVRHIEPLLAYPLGENALVPGNDAQQAARLLEVQGNADATTVVAISGEGSIGLTEFLATESLLGEEVEITSRSVTLPMATSRIIQVALNQEQRNLFLASEDGSVTYYDVSNKEEPRLIHHVKVTEGDENITSMRLLAGGISLLIGYDSGRIAQWFPVRDDDNNYQLKQVRDFHSQNSAIVDIAPEHSRKGFIAVDDSGHVGVYHSTAERTVITRDLELSDVTQVTVAPRANALLFVNTAQQMQYWEIDNEHPEVSWKSLWGKVWYESRQGPEYIWQSSSASSDFEPKFSLTPLAVGTLKASFYAMLFAIPLAIMGAIYTAYFMTSRMRGMVKPTIEVMEALPTVILGFLAGLWLAPLIESHLAGVFLVLILLPVMMILSGFIWMYLPASIRHSVPDGWEAALLIPVVIAVVLLAMSLSQPLEAAFFDGSLPAWLTRELGIDFDQRNSLVVGMAMGFAVIPTIFSISEDAIFSVPKHLTVGSLALGATPWQTLVKVVLLTASPGIFSGLMIGLGRAVGETMIVLMATGNTPIMDMNIFQGFRALSANIAVEMPESEVDSTHYRILFLAALVLFMATFFFNTVAEIVRQRLRRKYSSL